MTTLFKILAPALAAALRLIVAGCLTLAASAAVPVAWTNSPATPQPYPLKPVPHGVPVDFRVWLKDYTSPPIAPGADVRLWYQTNGMGSAWWSAPATFDGSVVAASFGPAEDTGADRVSLFFGAPSNVFASAILRLTHSPGFTPSSLPLPVPVLDFSAVSVLHAPWPDASDVTNAAEAAVGRLEESLKYGMDVGTGAVYGFAGDDYSSAYGLAWDGAWKYIRYGEGWATPGTELARMGDIPDLSHYATMEAATNAAAAVVARDAVTTSYGPGGGTFGWTGPHTIGGTSFDLFLPGGITIGNNTIRTSSYHTLLLPDVDGKVAVTGDLDGATNATLNAAKAYTDGATNATLNVAKAYTDGATNEISAQAASLFFPRASGALSLSYYPTYDELLFSKSNGDSLELGFGHLAWIVDGTPHSLHLSDVATAGSIGAAVSNTVTTAFIRQKLGVYLYVGEDGGVYVHTDNQ